MGNREITNFIIEVLTVPKKVVFIFNNFIEILFILEMGKQRRQRFKLHTPSINKSSDDHSSSSHITENDTKINLNNTWPLMQADNIFKNVTIDFNALKKDLSDDTKSVRSLKSNKSEGKDVQIVKKKDKIKARRELLLRKIDTINQLKKEMKSKKKPKKVLIIEDMSSLKDSLPTFKPLLKDKVFNCKTRGIKKAKERKKEHIESVNIYRKMMNLNNLKQNPSEAVQKHINNFLLKNQ